MQTSRGRSRCRCTRRSFEIRSRLLPNRGGRAVPLGVTARGMSPRPTRAPNSAGLLPGTAASTLMADAAGGVRCCVGGGDGGEGPTY